MKYDSKKELKQIFGKKQKPTVFTLPKMRYLTITGAGNPNGELFKKKIQALYATLYTVKFTYKNNPTDETFIDFVVTPLIGWWSINEQAANTGEWTKDDFIYELRIPIPYFITNELIEESIPVAKKKKGNHEIDRIKIKTYPPLRVGQILHVGPYDDEPKTFEKLEHYLEQKGLQRKNKNHVEIYLSDARKSDAQKQKVILQVEIQ